MADNLLDKASILLTPTAHNDGSMLSVKPENGDGDFTFSRGSAATRVNAQGLVENVQIISSELVSNGNFSQEGSELVTNGDFENGSNGWIISGSNLSIANGKATSTGSNFGAQFKQTILTTNKFYKLTFDIVDYTSGAIGLTANYYGEQNVFISVGTHTAYFTSLNQTELRLYSENFVGSIDNVSVKEVGQDWTLSNGSISDKYNASMTAYQSGIKITPFVKTGKYKVVFDLVVTSGSCKFDAGGGNDEIYTTSGTKEKLITNPTKFEFNAFNLGWVGTLDNISVKEITDDTDLPRINYEDGCGSWLLEPQSTNLIPYSSDYSQSFYNKDSGVSVGTTNNTSPSGDLNATQINVTDNGRIYANLSSLTYFSSVFIKAGTFSYFKFAGVNVDLVAQTISSGTIKSYGNGWFRIGVAFTGVRPFQVQAYPDATYSSHSTSGSYYIWGYQAEQQSYATSYIPTNGAIATRLADVANDSGNSTLINSTEGVLYAEIKGLANYNLQRWLGLSDGTNSNKVIIGLYNSATNYTIVVEVISSAVLSTYMTYDFGAVEPTFTKVAFKYKENDFALWVNGVEVATDTSGSAPIGLSGLAFDRGDGAQKFEGKAKALAVFPILTYEQLQSLTTQ